PILGLVPVGFDEGVGVGSGPLDHIEGVCEVGFLSHPATAVPDHPLPRLLLDGPFRRFSHVKGGYTPERTETHRPGLPGEAKLEVGGSLFSSPPRESRGTWEVGVTLSDPAGE